MTCSCVNIQTHFCKLDNFKEEDLCFFYKSEIVQLLIKRLNKFITEIIIGHFNIKFWFVSEPSIGISITIKTAMVGNPTKDVLTVKHHNKNCLIKGSMERKQL